MHADDNARASQYRKYLYRSRVFSRVELKEGGSGVNITTWDVHVYSHEEGMISFCLLDFKNYNVHLQCVVIVCMYNKAAKLL